MTNGYADNLEIDRRDNNGNYEPLNCRFVNEATQARHKRILSKNNTSGYRGVALDKRSGNFGASISVNEKRVHIGTFKTALDAAKAYDTYVIENGLEHTINGAIFPFWVRVVYLAVGVLPQTNKNYCLLTQYRTTIYR